MRLFVIRIAGIAGSAALLLGSGSMRHIEHASIDARQAAPGAQSPRSAGSVHLDGGSFRMGTDTAEIPALIAKYPDMPAELFAQETPAHEVVLAPFDLDRAEVTVKAFAAFVDANPRWRRSQMPASLDNGKYLSNWMSDAPAAADSALPVTFVTWHAATAYCEWRGARLPTEAEWEFAARAGHPGDAFPWGDGAPTPEVANWSASKIGKPVAVAHYDPNAFGLYDMAGNVWQYTADRWRDHYSDSDTGRVAAPSDILAMKPEALALEASRHVIRGGSFDAGVINMRVRYRDSHPANGAGPHVGFRCARSAGSAPSHSVAPTVVSVKSPNVAGDLRLERFTSTVFANTRYLRVLLPSGYDAPANAKTRYNVLYMADGQNLFDPATSVFGPSEWRVDETVQQLIADGRIPPMIVVGVDDAGASARAHEYLPWPDTINARRTPEYDPAPQGKEYPRFMINEVMPFINARYRTARGASHTGIGGSSYGALISVYTMLARPGVFGRALIESPTLQLYDSKVLEMLSRSHALPGRVYLAIGTNEDSAPNCDPSATPRDDMYAAFEQASTMLRTAGLDSARLRVVIEPCAEHRHAAWAARLPAALTFLFHEHKRSSRIRTRDSE